MRRISITAILPGVATLAFLLDPAIAQFTPTTPVWVQLTSGVASKFKPTVPTWVTLGNVGGVGISFVNVGDPGNNAYDGFGKVDYRYRIGRYEVNNQQYAIFLNAVASQSDPYLLYDSSMASSARGGIIRSGVPGSYTYATKPNMADKPVNFVSWMDAARFCNWLHNGQSTAPDSTEKGAYKLDGNLVTGFLPRERGARYWIPNRNEWFKAAFYKGRSLTAGYWKFPTKNNDTPVAVKATALGRGIPANRGNSANYNNEADWNGQPGNVTTVGRNGGPSAYGTYDQGGNVLEVAEDSPDGEAYLLGSSWTYGSDAMESVGGGWQRWRGPGGTTHDSERQGFRVGAR